MKALPLLLLLASPATAGPTGSVDVHAAPATGYPGAYLQTVDLALQQDPFYGSRLLDAFDLHLRSVTAMTAPRAVGDYLAVEVVGASTPAAVKARLGKEPLDPRKAAALLLAHALSRPDQFREVLDGLESRKAGLGKHTARLLREADGRGDKGLIAVLRSRGAVKPVSQYATYDRFGRLDGLFDGVGVSNGDVVDVGVPDGYTGYGPDGRPRRTGLLPARP